MSEPIEGDIVEAEVVMEAGTALGAISRAEIDMQVATARRYPRSIKKFKQDVYEMACLDEETAESMFYVLPRSGKRIEGPSARLAEIVGAAWGNIRYESDIVAIDETHITAMGSCMDLEKNAAVRIRVKRRITDSKGKRYNDDMIVVTGNAAASIALRNAVFKIVPFALIKPIYLAAKKLAVGEGKSMNELRVNMIAWYAKKGATQEQVLGLLGRRGIDDLTMEDLETLAGMRTALKDGDSNIDDMFGAVPTKGAKAKDSPLNETLKPGGNGNSLANTATDPVHAGFTLRPDSVDQTSDVLAPFPQMLANCKTPAAIDKLEEHWCGPDVQLDTEKTAWVREQCNAARDKLRGGPRGERANAAAGKQKEMAMGQGNAP